MAILIIVPIFIKPNNIARITTKIAIPIFELKNLFAALKASLCLTLSIKLEFWLFLLDSLYPFTAWLLSAQHTELNRNTKNNPVNVAALLTKAIKR